MLLSTGVASAVMQITLNGFRANEGGGGLLDLGWTGGNLGNTWAEGEWVPYKLVLTNVQDDYPDLDNLYINISYDFTNSNKRFVDLVRGIQADTTDLNDSQGWPYNGGDAYLLTTRAQIEAAQNDIDNTPPLDNNWAGFTLLNLPPEQINRALDGGIGTPTDAVRMFIITKQDLLNAGIPETANTIVIYWQLHESRSFIWNNTLQPGYDASPTNDWGGYLYNMSGFSTDMRLGSSYVPGSSGHIHLESLSGNKDVPIPIPTGLPGSISGYKWLDENMNQMPDPSEPRLSNWEIQVYGNIEGIDFTTSVLTNGLGEYHFPYLTTGTWIIYEILQSGYLQTYPYGGITHQQGTGINVTEIYSYTSLYQSSMEIYENVGPFGWGVNLTLQHDLQGDMNFGNFFAQPNLSITKTADNNISKVGDTVNYTFNISNTGNVNLTLNSVNDTVLGNISSPFPATLNVGQSVTVIVGYEVQSNDSDPLYNEVTANYSVQGMSTSVTATANHSVDLVHPAIEVTKTANTSISMVGDTIRFNVTVNNTGDVALVRYSFTDTYAGDISGNFSTGLGVGEQQSYEYDYIVQEGDSDPLNNTAEAHYRVESLSNDITDSDSVEVDLVHPNMTLTKTASPTAGYVGDTITYTIVINNTGDVQLDRINVTDSLMGTITDDFPAVLMPGESATVNKIRPIAPTDPNPLQNTVTAFYQVNSLPNIIVRQDSAEVEILHGDFRKEFTNASVYNESSGEWEPLTTPWVPVQQLIKWTVTFYVPNIAGYNMSNVQLVDRFGAELDHADWNITTPGNYSYTESQGTVDFVYAKAKQMPQLRVYWDIGELASGEQAILSFEVVTRLNPSGRQEYTSDGLKILNSGAVLKWRDEYSVQHSRSTASWYVMAGEYYGAVVGVVSNSSTGMPIKGAVLQLNNTSANPDEYVGSVETDQHGFYYFPDVTPGNYSVICMSEIKPVEVTGGNIEIVNFT
ncbi:MAG: DUF11 domain-containing protein [ANME-2 cluster archaeon]|nr:DUF11 domain-containing protein [ANME-2 cluster archaeon]